MANLFLFYLMACRPVHSIREPITSSVPNQNIGTIEAREYILIAYLEQYNQNTEESMQAFSNAQDADPSSPIIFLLWGDSAWDQGLHEKANWAWKEYEQRIETSDTEKIEQIKERLERS
jgi:hypothetical protein